MRASHLQANLRAIDGLGVETARVVREELAAIVREVEASLRTRWLPLEYDLEMTRALESVVGIAGVRRWSQEAIVVSARGPLLGPLLRGLQALGLNPHRALRRAPMGWGLIYRDFGEIAYEEQSEATGTLVHSSVPPAHLDQAIYYEGVAGAWEGVIDLTGGHRPRVEVAVDRPERRIVYRCSWSDR